MVCSWSDILKTLCSSVIQRKYLNFSECLTANVCDLYWKFRTMRTIWCTDQWAWWCTGNQLWPWCYSLHTPGLRFVFFLSCLSRYIEYPTQSLWIAVWWSSRHIPGRFSAIISCFRSKSKFGSPKRNIDSDLAGSKVESTSTTEIVLWGTGEAIARKINQQSVIKTLSAVAYYLVLAHLYRRATGLILSFPLKLEARGQKSSWSLTEAGMLEGKEKMILKIDQSI